LIENLMAVLPATRIVALAVAVLVLELALVSIWHRRTGRGVSFADMVGSVFAGIFLLLALFAALASAGWVWIVTALSAAFFAHIADLIRRWKR
jgi:asparagine N-glycosylation enzyme membrane subunit Stt3